ncbi:hypothetical protein EW146_g6624 [Bondarzewia mesenterica]|uniref:G-protein coupled receptors family 1 profile domain-containing protein n=1 Tax=Bondarzewia mesenterica TaxID=1095465 RepID=A0A4S4LN26_9AGAM|nr:hypothetical protein EW146_g6624 [Bondarzewia mesenterica]
MLPFALKVVWFVLSLLGTASSWAVLIPFAKAVGVTWAPVLYCLAVTVLETTFCLGMIWHMDPYRMPRAFCIAQATVMSFCVYVITGVCACFTICMYSFVLRPKRLSQFSPSPLAWRGKYLLLVVVFPLAALAAYLAVIIKFDAVQPSDDMHCDTTSPLWARLLSYAGVPLLLSIPAFFISCSTAYRLTKLHIQTKRYRYTYNDNPSFTRFPAQCSRMTNRNLNTASRPASIIIPASNMRTLNNMKHATTASQATSLPSTPTRTLEFSSKASQTTLRVASHFEHPALPSPPTLHIPPPSPVLSISTHCSTHRSNTPSPITFAPVPPAPPRRRPSGMLFFVEPSEVSYGYVPTLPDSGVLAYSPIPAEHETTVASPSSPSRAPVVLDVEMEPRRGFHYPLRPSLELSPEYSAARNQLTFGLPTPSDGPGPATQSLKSEVVDEDFEKEDEIDEITLESLGWMHDRTHEDVDGKSVLKEDLEIDEDPEPLASAAMGRSPRSRLSRQSVRPSLNLGPAIWRLTIFKMARADSLLRSFFIIMTLASLSTLIDLSKHRPPSPFGTQHVALLLAAWGPMIVFGASFINQWVSQTRF